MYLIKNYWIFENYLETNFDGMQKVGKFCSKR
jgi:hypothetical protein